MKTITHFLIVITAVLTFQSSCFADTLRTYFDAKKTVLEKEYEGTYDNNQFKKNGFFKHYFEYSEGIYEEGSFLNNEKHGLFITYYENGEKHWVRSYQNGLLFGNEEYYESDGSLSYTGIYKIKPDGLVYYEQHFETGELKRITHLLNNKFHGEDVELNKNGDTIKSFFFKDNLRNGPFRIFNNDNKIIQKGIYKDDLLNDTLFTFFPNGSTKNKTYFESGKPNGILLDYYPNKQEKLICYYKNDTLHGERKTFFENGNLASKAKMVHGKINGLYLSYHENGASKDSTEYEYGTKNGLFAQYASNGTLLAKGKFKNGRYHGSIKYFVWLHLYNIHNCGLFVCRFYSLDLFEFDLKNKSI